jgi:hypothetical protein
MKPQQVLEHIISVLVMEAQGEARITEEEVARLHQVEHPATFARLWLSFLFLRSVLEGREKAKQTELMETLYLVQQTYQGQPQERIRAAVALMPPDELPGFLGPDASASRTQPDLLSSLVWFLDKARSYDKKKQRDHIEEVHKKRLRYGLVTAAQLEEERRAQGVVLAREDWGRVDMVLVEIIANV